MPTSTWFVGAYEHSLDSKGRVILPSKMRAAFGQVVYMTPHLEDCIALWTPEEFGKEVNLRLESEGGGAQDRNSVRDWASFVQQQDLDRQGRMVIPPKLREYAALDQDVLLVGVINRIEIWSPARWAEKNNLAAGGATPRRRGAARQSAEGRQAGGSRRSGATRPAGSARSTGSPGSPGSTGSPGSGQSAGTTRESDAGTQVRGGGQGRPAPRTRTGDPPEGDREG